jgi:predicted transcriptional regulator
MEVITIRVDEAIAAELRELAAEERETITTIVRRYVRRGLKQDGRDVDVSRAHEGTGRVQ